MDANVFELNNKLIAEAYAVSKRREYVQHHIGEVEMDVLDSIGEDPMEAYSRAMQFVKKQQAASARRGQMVEDDEDDSRS